jgi:hypothetical protein
MTDTELLSDLLLAWEETPEATRPTAEELCGDRADLVPELKRRIQALTELRWVATHSQSDEPAAGMEPVTGYRLVALLGKGGFGQVWRADGAGGFPVALKLLPLDVKNSRSEIQALVALRNVRHPNLLALLGVWQTRAWFVVVSELADQSLYDLLQAERAKGGCGLPMPDLLEYMRWAAAGIDYLHSANIQHRDIKPQNLLLQGGGPKVADFGLARVVHHTETGHTGAMTFDFAAPEFFEGRTSRQSDQYSLAVTYCLLRGGRLPFVGTPAQVMAGHLKERPNLDMVPELERPVVQRALSKRPEDRWPSCSDFVERLAAPSTPRAVGGMRMVAAGVAGAVIVVMLVLAIGGRKREQGTVAQPRPAEDAIPTVQPETPKQSGREREVEKEPAARVRPVPGRTFVFDGFSAITTSIAQSEPVTLEAWIRVRALPKAREPAYLFAVQGKSGISLLLNYSDVGLPFLSSREGITSTSDIASVPIARWVHVAGVFTDTNSTLFIDGRLVATEQPVQPAATSFVIGSAGATVPKNGFVGAMRMARITKGVRYAAKFAPPARFDADEQTVGVFDADDTKSRRGNEGAVFNVYVEMFADFDE